MNPNDSIREAILQYFYDRNAQATSQKGKRGSHVTISDVKKELKQRHGFTQPQVMSNLTYLIDSGWVEEVAEERQFRTRAGTAQPSTKTWYKVTAKGIDKVEGGSSVFSRPEPLAGVNITALDSVVQVGDGNVVNKKNSDLHEALELLRADLLACEELRDQQKVEVIADIDAMKAQLAKAEPSRGVLQAAWSSVQGIATTAGLVASVARITTLLSQGA